MSFRINFGRYKLKNLNLKIPFILKFMPTYIRFELYAQHCFASKYSKINHL